MASQSEVLANLRTLQARLEKDSRARNAFLKDPAAVLQRQGVALPAARRSALKNFIDQQLAVPNSRVTGATIRPGGNPLATEVEVSVKVKF